MCEPGGCSAPQDKAGALQIRMTSSQASFPPRNLHLGLGSCLDLPLSAPARLTAFRNFRTRTCSSIFTWGRVLSSPQHADQQTFSKCLSNG